MEAPFVTFAESLVHAPTNIAVVVAVSVVILVVIAWPRLPARIKLAALAILDLIPSLLLRPSVHMLQSIEEWVEVVRRRGGVMDGEEPAATLPRAEPGSGAQAALAGVVLAAGERAGGAPAAGSVPGFRVPLSTDFREDVRVLSQELRELAGLELFEKLAAWILATVPDTSLVSLYAIDWLRREYRCVGMAGPEGDLSRSARSRDRFPIGTRTGMVAASIRDAMAAGSSGDRQHSQVIDDITADGRVLEADPRAHSEATWVVTLAGRPVMVIDMQSRTVGRFGADNGWREVSDRVAHAVRDIAPHVHDILFERETAICEARAYDSFERTKSGILDLLDQMAAGARQITDSGPELATVVLFKPGSRDPAGSDLRGLAISGRLRRRRDQFAEALASYSPDVKCPTRLLMERAVDARLKGSKRQPCPYRYSPGAATCVPRGFKHEDFVGVPVVGRNGAWLAIIYLHYLRRHDDVEFDEFCGYQLQLYADSLAEYLTTKTREWFR